MRTRGLFGMLWAGGLVFACSAFVLPGLLGLSPQRPAGPSEPPTSPRGDTAPVETRPVPSPSSSPAAAAPEYDVSPLRRPRRDYIGLAMAGVPRDMGPVHAFVRRTGSRPNVITIYQSFEDDFAASEVRKVHRYGGLAIVRWEPYTARLSDIAKGRHDDYIRSFALDVRRTNAPVAMTFGHEMNGFWYPWGAPHNQARDFVGAWRRIHRIFAAADATNVIWAWAPNVISGAPGVRLAPWYPGDATVDWIGIDGYFTNDGPRTYRDLFGPTMDEIGRFTDKPFLIVETGAEPGPVRAGALRSLFTGVAEDRRMIGFVYFNQPGRRQWQLDGDSAALTSYAQHSKRLPYGFRVR